MWVNFWNLRVNERLCLWKDFRKKLDTLDLKPALNELNSSWGAVPFVGYYLDPADPDSWPEPWTLIAENYWCDLAKALGILYTLYFTEHRNSDIDLRIFYSNKNKVRHHLVFVNQGEHILNYYPWEIVNIESVQEDQLQLLYQYSPRDLNLSKY